MKKVCLILTIILLFLVFVSCSPSSNLQDEPSDIETEEILVTESESESNTELKHDMVSNYGIHYLDAQDVVEDTKILREFRVNPPLHWRLVSDFVDFVDINAYGGFDFVDFVSYRYGRVMYTRYQYNLLLTDGGNCSQKISLLALHDDLSESTLTEEVKQEYLPALYFRENYTVVTDHEGDDLRVYWEISEPVDYFCNGIRYTYEGGNLTEIHWTNGESKFWFTFEDPLYSETYDAANTGAWHHPLMKLFLSKEQTAGAVEQFDQLITAERADYTIVQSKND